MSFLFKTNLASLSRPRVEGQAVDYFMRFARKATPNKIKTARLSQIARHLFKPHDQTYDHNYYAEVDVFAVDSADAMAKTITERFQPKTVIDVGCGTGALLEAFGGLGCEARGLEYSEAALAYCRRRKLSVRKFNLKKDSPDEPRYDLATSFEVAEHLAPWVAKRYVGLLCALSPLVVMSAATPGQGGRDHINEQPQSYWIKKFKRCNYLFDEKSSRELSLDWRTLGVTSWYRDNLMVFAQIPQTVMARLAFWQRLYVRLAKLSNRIDATTQGKVLGAICAELRSKNARLSYQCAALIEALKVRGATDDFIRIITNERSSTMRPEEISRAIERIR